eukprot:TRINITY_DN19102_c0_g2_i1.p4 TRINITY_DN19102_c0_g2~~TRINITY_DN19102_c0_g2_i1.p4  ORF type:complete len:104 (-),score=0.41 TRINITY_DN19102_c0_g2_i1:329-640(-)
MMISISYRILAVLVVISYFGTCDACACIQVWDPVCCFGQTITNLGCAICQGFLEDVCTPGECDPFCICPAVYSPVCCFGITYGNKCEAICDGLSPGICTDGGC